MNIDTKLLDLLFCRITPERILADLKEQLRNPLPDSDMRESANTFLNFAETTLSAYSEDEQRLLYQKLKQTIEACADDMKTAATSLCLLIRCGEEMLSVDQHGKLCKREKVLAWRDVYLRLGQNTIVCPYLAWLDLRANNHQRKNFAWPAILKTDDRLLQDLLDKGVAENHCHLNGSTQLFDLTWCKLMNDLTKLEEDLKLFSHQYRGGFSRGPQDNVLTIQQRVTLAALIRTILFRLIHRDEFSDSVGGAGECSSHFDGKTAFQEEYLQSFLPLSTAMARIDQLRGSYGASLTFPEQSNVCLDYALEPHVLEPVKDEPYRILAGERHLLYQCAKEILQNHFSQWEKELFFLYQQLKIAFRGEMIQVNGQVGFQNFANYQDRKDAAWEKNNYWWEACRMSMSGAFSVDNHSTLEARFGPGRTKSENISRIEQFDKAKLFGDGEASLQLPTPEDALDEKHFYVLHFAKRKDKTSGIDSFLVLRRHDAFRDDVKKRAIALAQALSESSYFCARVRGIDACSNELPCRPEVFASAFRFLRGFRAEQFVQSNESLSERIAPKLSITFHAGEDYFDISDGIRAVDEAIHYLGLRRGDRIGHGLALGIDPELHYRNKDYIAVMSKQTRLDNLVWLLFRSVEFGVEIDTVLKERLKRDAESLLQEIYGCAIGQNNWAVGLREYYLAMKLRGDEPNLYRYMTYHEPDDWQDPYAQFEVNDGDSSLKALRQNKQISGLYYVYQFGTKEKKIGDEIMQIDIEQSYIHLMKKMQDAMQEQLANRGILIECNPSSNVLIGTFRAYDKHPIFRFNNEYLGDPARQQLCVSVNTDDLGVFDTSLEFEYALLYQTLREMTDDDGKPRYKDAEIRHYLENLRAMGETSTFPCAEIGCI